MHYLFKCRDFRPKYSGKKGSYMVFDKRTVSGRRRALDAKAVKRFSRLRILVTTLLVVVIAGGALIGTSAIYGTYKGVLEISPDIGTIDVSPKGFSTFVYDAAGNEIAKLVSTDSNRIPVGLEDIPENLAHAFVAIEDERFYQHRGIDIPGSVEVVQGFKGCTGLKEVTINGSREIGEEAFENCINLETLILNDGTRYIRSGAFRYCGMTTVDIPSSVWEINIWAFDCCYDLTKAIIHGSPTIFSGAFPNNTELIYAE